MEMWLNDCSAIIYFQCLSVLINKNLNFSFTSRQGASLCHEDAWWTHRTLWVRPLTTLCQFTSLHHLHIYYYTAYIYISYQIQDWSINVLARLLFSRCNWWYNILQFFRAGLVVFFDLVLGVDASQKASVGSCSLLSGSGGGTTGSAAPCPMPYVHSLTPETVPSCQSNSL